MTLHLSTERLGLHLIDTINLLYPGNPWTGTFANSKDLDKMLQYAAFHQGLQFLVKSKHS